MGKALMPKKEFFLCKGEVLVGSSQDVAHPYVFVGGMEREASGPKTGRRSIMRAYRTNRKVGMPIWGNEGGVVR